MVHDLLKTLDKQQKLNWPWHLPSLVFAYNAMPHNVTGDQPYDLNDQSQSISCLQCMAWACKIK